ncbi:MAG: hypothetical protein B1H09_00710 [Gemmatimonadaceae bacterium 4484_173]|nr:MAG: hypothetical protein B1H09_00710 [Gemmatimonadaceae bacterium 4484_173]RKZ04269.1 MAG: hypothetical protein DRQ21_03245 [Candidatus Fermentibacteria bacterium]
MPVKDSAAVILMFTVLWFAAAVPVYQSPLGHYPVVDAAWHNAWAQDIARGDVFVFSPYFRAPLYPAVLGLVYSIFGDSIVSGTLLSLLFGILSVHLIHRIVFDRAGRKASLVSASVWMLYGVNLFYTTTLLITPMYTFLLLCSFYLLDRDRPDYRGWVFLGLAAITRPGAVLLLPVALILYRKIWKWSWLFFVPVALVWMINGVHGDWGTVISSQGGINLYIGNGPDADGFTAFAPGEETVSADSFSYPDNVWAASNAPFEEPVPPSEVSSWWVVRTVRFVADDPLRFLQLTARKLLYLISPVAVPSNYDIYYMARYSPVLKVLAGTPRVPVSGLLIWLLIPGALLAGKLNFREKNSLLWASVLAAGVLPFFVTARFRLPIVPFMVIFLVPRVLKNTGRSLLLGSAGVAAGLFIAWATAGTVEAGGVNMAFHDGVAHFRQGDSAGAEVLLLEAVDIAFSREDDVDLNGVDALFNLGVISIRRGDTESAVFYWEKAVFRDPDYAPARQALAGLTR